LFFGEAKHMKKIGYLCFALFLSVYTMGKATPTANAGLDDFLKDATKIFDTGKGLSNSDIIDGLKEALQIGTDNTVSTTSRINGYYKNAKIRIPLPDAVKKVEKFLRVAGYGENVDGFVLSMNRAAERAAPEAKSLFWDAIKQMTFDDAKRILNGKDNEATLYFKDRTWNRLQGIFKPIVHNAMSSVGVTKAYQDLDAKVRSIPFADNIVDFDLDEYVTTKALDGLFLMLAEEEAKIRKDPAARVTDLLKKVFGKNG
jgi:hypothetical protein